MIRSTVRKAARLAVYEEMMMSVKNHQMPPTMRVEAACGFSPDPCRRNVPVMNQNEFDTENCARRREGGDSSHCEFRRLCSQLVTFSLYCDIWVDYQDRQHLFCHIFIWSALLTFLIKFTMAYKVLSNLANHAV